MLGYPAARARNKSISEWLHRIWRCWNEYPDWHAIRMRCRTRLLFGSVGLDATELPLESNGIFAIEYDVTYQLSAGWPMLTLNTLGRFCYNGATVIETIWCLTWNE